MSRAYFILSFALIITGCGDVDIDTSKLDNSSPFQGNSAHRNSEVDEVYDADNGGVEMVNGKPMRLTKGRWDPPARRKKPLTGSARARQLKYLPMINQEAKRAGIDPRFVHAIISRESRYNTMAISTICKGKPKVCFKDWRTAHGLMQIMPATAKSLGLAPSMRRSHPRLNVRAGIKYLVRMKWAKGNMQAMAAGYNSGPARAKALFQGNRNSKYWRGAQVSTSNGVPGKRFWGGETYHYAQHVAGFYDLYKANPQLIGLGVKPQRRSSCMERELC